MKLRKHLVWDCIFALLIGLIISATNYYFLIPETYNYALPMFFVFSMFGFLLSTYIERYLGAKNNQKKNLAYFVVFISDEIIALEASIVAIARTTMDGIKWSALFITLISWSIFFILAIARKPKELENKH